MGSDEVKPSETASQVGDRSIDFKQIQKKVGPIAVMIGEILMKGVDLISWVVDEYGDDVMHFVEKYHVDELGPALWGLAMTFFGGVYMVLISAIEAANIFGMHRVVASLQGLWKQIKVAKVAYEKDNLVDENKDGVADVSLMDKSQLAARKAMVILKAVDPNQLAEALEGLTQAWIAVIATLRVKFAQAITLGTSIGNNLDQFVSPFIMRVVNPHVPREYAKWVPVSLKYTFRYMGVALAFKLMRYVSAVFVGLKGSEIFFFGLSTFLVRHNYLEKEFATKGNPLITAGFTALGLFGAYVQIARNFSIPFPFNVLCLPLTIAEKVLMFCVGSKGLPGDPGVAGAE
ncbi:hypothetical protein FVE85_1120 [Porphyridium purpureum]|uniref:Uncharacterized protein n=1 Tax=Porphyridium purpureum TaxID=35688 RepID=A0A5J4Z0J9_PORPP|nr:hypothetical protein FVE85_1120 [Porphyridium purpureum]|eukprot:POR4404..scf208_2